MTAAAKYWVLVSSLLSFLLASACGFALGNPAREPDSALGEELSIMLTAAQESHLSLLGKYMDEHREKAKKFLSEEWYPAHIKSREPESSAIQDIEGAESEYRKRREIIMDVLDDVERSLKQAVYSHYEKMVWLNKALSTGVAAGEREAMPVEAKAGMAEVFPFDEVHVLLEELVHFQGETKDVPGMAADIKALLIVQE